MSIKNDFEAPHLTPRELEVLNLVCEGLPNKGIGRVLKLSIKTVDCHIQSIYQKIGVQNSPNNRRVKAAVLAERSGWLKPGLVNNSIEGG